MDFVIPPNIRHVKIDHKQSKFSFGDGVEAESFNGVPIGLVKHRIMWPSDESGNRTPICRSSDSQFGYPRNPNPSAPHQIEAEYWKDVPIAVDQKTGRVHVNCFSCPHRGDGRRKQGQDGPRCTPEWSLILGSDTPGKAFVLGLRGSSLWKAHDYLKEFERAQMPPFTHRISLALQAAKGNNIRYSELFISKLDPSDRSQWTQYLDTFLKVREHLEAPPKSSGGNGPSSKIVPLSM